MNLEILQIAEQLGDAYEGEPWFGRSISDLLNEVDEAIVFEKPNGQHSIVELLWHMITWKEFALSRLRNDDQLSIKYFEQNDWRIFDHCDKTLWKQGLQEFSKLHNELVAIVRQQNDELLCQRVPDRKYDFRKLLYGMVQHDIYHLGQIAYIKKMLTRY